MIPVLSISVADCDVCAAAPRNSAAAKTEAFSMVIQPSRPRRDGMPDRSLSVDNYRTQAHIRKSPRLSQRETRP